MAQQNPPGGFGSNDPGVSQPGAAGGPAPSAAPGPGGPVSPGDNEVQFGPTATRAAPKRALLLGGLLAVVVLVGAGGTFAYTVLASTGAQPAEVVPSTAIGYVRVDLDPSAGQKIAATRFLGKLPKVKTQGADVDVKQTLWSWIAGSDPKLKKLAYDTDVKPWLGDRAAVALMPGVTAKKPDLVFALQVTDEGKAKEGIAKIATTSGADGVDVTARDGFALITPKGSSALADLDKGSLATNTGFTADMKAMGDQGIASMWFDGKALGDLAAKVGGPVVDPNQLGGLGRVSMALRFDADFVELAGITRGATTKPDTAPPTGGAASLPEDTMVALQSNGLGDAVAKGWPQLEKSIGSSLGADSISGIEKQLGVKLPDDLQVLLGKSLTLSLPDQDLSNVSKAQDPPRLGAKIVTTNGARADEVVQSLVEKAGVDNFVKRKIDGDKVFLATTDDYLAALQRDGKLGQTDAFRKAVRDGDTATTAIFVNLDRLEPTYVRSVPADYQEFTKALRAVGMSASQNADGEGTFSLRLVGN